MLKSYWVLAQPSICMSQPAIWWVAYSILVSAPVPFGFRAYWDLVGVGLGQGGLGTKGLGTGLDNRL